MENVEVIKLPNGKFTFVNKKGERWDEEFKSISYEDTDFPIVECEDGWTYVDVKNHKVFNERFGSYITPFTDGVAAVELLNGEFSFVDKNGKVWPERFNLTSSFQDGLAVVRFGDGTYTFIDKKHRIWKEKFQHAMPFTDGLARVRVLGKYTFIDKNHVYWLTRFDSVYPFSEGMALVGLPDHKVTFVDKNQNLWPLRFYYANSFKEGLAVVQLEDGSWTYVTKDQKIWSERFVYASDFKNGIARVKKSVKGFYSTIDRFGRVWDDLKAAKLAEIYQHPSSFLKLKTEDFKDNVFIDTCLAFIKDRFLKDLEGKDVVDDLYADKRMYFLEKCKEKTQSERQKIEHNELLKAEDFIIRKNLTQDIQDFEF